MELRIVRKEAREGERQAKSRALRDNKRNRDVGSRREAFFFFFFFFTSFPSLLFFFFFFF